MKDLSRLVLDILILDPRTPELKFIPYGTQCGPARGVKLDPRNDQQLLSRSCPRVILSGRKAVGFLPFNRHIKHYLRCLRVAPTRGCSPLLNGGSWVQMACRDPELGAHWSLP